LSGTALLVDAGTRKLAVQLFDGSYHFDLMLQLYRGADGGEAIECDGPALCAVIERVALLTSSVDDGVYIKLEDGRIHVSAATSQGVSEDEMAVDYTGPKVRLRINPRLVVAAIAHLGQTIDFSIPEDQYTPIAFRSKGTARAFVMRMALEAPKARDPEAAVSE
jgi:hypothetical protein